jgi:hypothetical protein
VCRCGDGRPHRNRGLCVRVAGGRAGDSWTILSHPFAARAVFDYEPPTLAHSVLWFYGANFCLLPAIGVGALITWQRLVRKDQVALPGLLMITWLLFGAAALLLEVMFDEQWTGLSKVLTSVNPTYLYLHASYRSLLVEKAPAMSAWIEAEYRVVCADNFDGTWLTRGRDSQADALPRARDASSATLLNETQPSISGAMERRRAC